jgi:hypothetical protein
LSPPRESKGRTIGDHQVFSIGGRMRGTEASVRRRGGGGRASASTGGGRARAAFAVPRAGRGDPTDASGGNLSFCFLPPQRSRSPLLCGALGFPPATCAEARFCPPKRHILRTPPAPPPHPTAVLFLKAHPSPRTPRHRRLQFGETWPPPNAGEGRKQILTKPCWRTNVSTGGGRAKAAG